MQLLLCCLLIYLIDVAFLDINMRLNGMDLADELHNINPELKIVFVTAYNNYASEAFQRDAYGYLLKPYDEDQLKKVLTKVGMLKKQNQAKQIYFQTIPHFVLYIDNQPCMIKSNRLKEILAYLVDAEGKSVSHRELVEHIWDNDEGINSEKLINVRVTISNLKRKLKELDIDYLLISQYGQFCLDTSKYNWDVWELQNGNQEIIKRYDGRYLEEYSWAEYTNARITDLLNS